MIEDRIVNLRDGLRWGLSTNLELGDDDLEYNLFEQFDPFVWTDLHSDNLRPLVCHEGISEEDYALFLRLRAVWLEACNLGSSANAIRQLELTIRKTNIWHLFAAITPATQTRKNAHHQHKRTWFWHGGDIEPYR